MGKFLKIVGILILLVVLFFGYIFYMGSSRGPVIEKRVTEFIQLASDGKSDEAFELLSKEAKSTGSPEDFGNAVSAHFDGLTFVEQSQDGYYFSVVLFKRSGLIKSWPRNMYEYTGTVIYSGDREGNVVMTFVRESGEWKILNFTLDDPYTVY